MTGKPFLFGKLPAHGDFVARGLAAPDREAWDSWGAALLADLQAAAPDGFEAAHVAAPPWRFVVATATGWRAGALAPSVDSVGRRFLLALGADGLSGQVAGAAGLAFAAEAEVLIYDALARSLNADALLAAASERFADLHAASAGVATLLAAAPAEAAGVWWTLGSPDFAPSAFAAVEPPSDLFARTVAVTAPAPTVSSAALVHAP